MKASARSRVRSARSSAAFEGGARLGFAVSGLLHVLIGGLAIAVAVGAGGHDADQSGALKQLADTPGGILVIWVVAIGLFALASWEVVNGVLLPQGADRTWTKRVSSGGKAIAYAAVLATTVAVAVGARTSSAKSSTTLTASLLSAPGGVLLIIAVGLTVLGIGVFFVVNGIRQGFRRDIRMPGGAIGIVTGTLGSFGYVAKGIALIVVGILFVVGAVTADPSQTSGLDGALKALADLPFGKVILAVIAIGLIAYGLYSVLRARFAKL